MKTGVMVSQITGLVSNLSQLIMGKKVIVSNITKEPMVTGDTLENHTSILVDIVTSVKSSYFVSGDTCLKLLINDTIELCVYNGDTIKHEDNSIAFIPDDKSRLLQFDIIDSVL